jgi:hypothetical protein
VSAGVGRLQKQRLSGSAIRRARLLLPPAAAVPGVLHSYAYGVLGRYETLRINIRFEFEPKQINMEATAQFAVDVVAPPAPAHMPRPFAQLAAQSSLRYTQIVFQKNTEVLRLQLGITSVGVLCSRRVLLTFFYLFGPYRNVFKLLFSLTFAGASSSAKRHSRQVNPLCFHSLRMQHES